MIVGMNRRMASERSAGELATAVGDHLVYCVPLPVIQTCKGNIS